ncbi:MAG: HTTM domain-containing protein [Pseudobdellovibrionaceae bacterium]
MRTKGLKLGQGMITQIRSIIDFLDQFFFRSIPNNVGICRFILGSVIFYLSLMKSFELDFFRDAGMVSRESALILLHEAVRPLFTWNFWPDQYLIFVHTAVLILSLFFALGVLGRIATAIFYCLYMGIIYRNYAVLFGADVISSLFLFYFILIKSNDQFSVLTYLKDKLNWTRGLQILPNEIDQMLSSAGVRLLQIQVIVIYTYTGFEKLRGNSWWNGTALWTVLSNPQMVIWDLKWTYHFPMIIGIMTFSAILFEVFFGAAMIHPRLRSFWLLAGFAFHLMIGISMDLLPFSFVMLSVYFLFMKEFPWRLSQRMDQSS